MNRRTIDFLRFFFEAHRVRSVSAIALLGIAGLLEGVGVVSLIPILQVADRSTADPTGFSAYVTKALSLVGLEPTLLVLITLLFVAILAKAVFVWVAMTQVRVTIMGVVRGLRLRLLNALLNARLRLFTTQKAGEWANAVTQEALSSGAAYREGCEILAAVFPITAYVSLATAISWQTSVFALVAGAVLLGALRGFVGLVRRSGSEQAALMRKLAGLFVDVIGGLKPIKAMAREHLIEPMLEDSIEELDAASRRQIYANEHTRFFQEPALTLFMGVGIYFLFAFQGLPLSTIIVLAFMFYRIIQNLNTLQMRYQILVVGEAAFWSLMDRIQETERERERPHKGIDPGPLSESLRMEGVSFAYDGIDVLRDLSLEVTAGRFVALSGGSGSGKTTLVDLIAGLHTPKCGRILVDGRDLEALDLKAWRAQIGYVPQEMLLLNDSVRRNVTLGDPAIDDAAVERALRLAGAWDFVASNPAGLDASVGERGTRLSGGQRQRIAIARALVTRPSLLILDEVTTALDPDTEAAICETLGGLRGEVTILSISHQSAMRAVADETWTMDHGRLVHVERSREDATIRSAEAGASRPGADALTDGERRSLVRSWSGVDSGPSVPPGADGSVVVSVTIDTEEDDWGSYAHEGATVRNILELSRLQEVFDRWSVRPTYLVNHPPLLDSASTDVLAALAEREDVELGTHCHPWNTPPFTGEGAERSMMCRLSVEQNRRKVEAITQLIRSELGVEPRAFRAGRWGFGPTVAEALVEVGYQIDCSVTPFVDWTGSGGPDFSTAPYGPYRFHPARPLDVAPDGSLLQLPPTIGFPRGDQRRSARARTWLESHWLSRHGMVGVLDRMGFLARRWLSPESSSGDTMVRIARSWVDSGQRFVEVALHSCALLPGLMPSVKTPDDRDELLASLDTFFRYCTESGFGFATLSEAGEAYLGTPALTGTDAGAPAGS